MKLRYYYLIFLIAWANNLFAQSDYDTRVSNYIAQYKDVAIEEMQRAHIPASITLAQGILESDAGKSPLATDANNHFGIKCHEDWTGGTYTYDDDKKDECFRKYNSAQESYKDHSDFLINKPRYAFLFKYEANDYKDWAFGLKQAGYATNPKYAQLLINNIEKYKLYEFDNPAIDNPQKQDSITKAIAVTPVSKYVPVLPEADDIGARVFYINRVRAAKLLPGETLDELGKRFDIGLRRVLKYNDWAADHKEPPGTVVFLQLKRRSGDSLYYMVQNNETMYDISQEHGIQLSYLYQRNHMEPGTEPANGEVIYMTGDRVTTVQLRSKDEEISKPVPPQQKSYTRQTEPQQPAIVIQQPVMQQPALASDSSAAYITIPDDYKYYTVKPGDTIYSISKAYKLDVERLKEMNKLYSDIIYEGMRLKVAD